MKESWNKNSLCSCGEFFFLVPPLNVSFPMAISFSAATNLVIFGETKYL